MSSKTLIKASGQLSSFIVLIERVLHSAITRRNDAHLKLHLPFAHVMEVLLFQLMWYARPVRGVSRDRTSNSSFALLN